MAAGYVIFTNISTYNTFKNNVNTNETPTPIPGRDRRGNERRDRQATNEILGNPIIHPNSPVDVRVMQYLDEDLALPGRDRKLSIYTSGQGFTFLRRNQVTEWFPDEL